MKTMLAAGLAIGLALSMTACNILDDQAPDMEPTKTQVQIYGSAAQPDAVSIPVVGDLYEIDGTIDFTRFFSDLSHVGVPVQTMKLDDPMELYHLRARANAFPPALIGITELPDGEYRCASGILTVTEFKQATVVINKRVRAWDTCTPAVGTHAFGPICFRTGGLGPFELTVDGQSTTGPWADLGVTIDCPVDGGVGTISLVDGESFLVSRETDG